MSQIPLDQTTSLSELPENVEISSSDKMHLENSGNDWSVTIEVLTNYFKENFNAFLRYDADQTLDQIQIDQMLLDFAKYDVLILRANHIPAGLQHVRFNLLGKYVKFTSPLYNLPS